MAVGHCHEIGHQIGLTDKYTGIREVGKYGVMSKGNWNGPNRKGECPAHITAVGKIQLGWVSPNVISSNTSVTLNPVENSSSSVYEIISDNTTNYAYYILENRSTLAQFSSFDQYLPGRKDCSGGLLIWALDYHSYSVERFVAADNDFDILATDGGDYFPGTTNNTDFDGITEPSSNFGINNDIASGLSVHNVSKNVLNGKINCDLVLNEWIGKIITSLSWNDSISVIGDVFVHADTIGGDTLSFSSFSKKSKFGNKHTQFTQSMIDDDVILTISSGSVVYLNGHLVKSSGTKGGILNRENNVTFIPDIQLLKNGTSLIGQYSDISSAISDANSGDEIVVNGSITISSDVTVFSGLTFSIQPSAVIKLTSGIEISINGTLNAQGTSANPITFISANASPAAGDWQGIVFDNGDDNSTINNCLIEYATVAVNVNNTDLTIEQSTIKNNSGNGIKCNQASPTIYHNMIESNGIGIYCQSSSSPYINNNYVINNTSYGIFCTQTSNPDIRHNDISNNGAGGVCCMNSSSPMLTGKSSSEPYGANKVIYNGGNGISAYSNSHPNLGFHLGNYAGYNDIHGNSSRHVFNYTTNTIQAWRNWWGSAEPDSELFYGPVDYSAPLSSASPYAGPDWGQYLAKSSNHLSQNSPQESEQYLIKALESEGAADYEQAIASYRYVIDQYGNTEYGSFALARLMVCRVKQGDITVEKDYIQLVQQKYGINQTGTTALLWQPLIEVRAGNKDEALSFCDNIKNRYSDTNLIKEALFLKASIQLYELNDIDEA